MQAYATAAQTPQDCGFRGLAAPAWNRAATTGTRSMATAPADGASCLTGPPTLASVLVDSLDDETLALLARRLTPHLGQPAQATVSSVAYTVASLASELGVSAKTIRCAIARQELRAVKRGARWIISSQAVAEWVSTQDEQQANRRRRESAPKAAGPLLRSVLCEGTHAAAASRRPR
jgi:excisionase family DNA binding protein